MDAFAFIVAVVVLVILNEKLKNYCHGQRDTQKIFLVVTVILELNFLVCYEKQLGIIRLKDLCYRQNNLYYNSGYLCLSPQEI